MSTEDRMVEASEKDSGESGQDDTSQEPEAGQGTGDKEFAFNNLEGKGATQPERDLDFILDIPLEITVELGRTKMLINDLLKLGQGSIIELSKAAGETLEILANNRLIAKGDVVVVNDKYGIRLTEVISTVKRLEQLK